MTSGTVLALESSTDLVSAAVVEISTGGVRLVAQASARGARSHTRVLLGLFEEVLATARLERAELAGLAVGIGPGTFTGVRIGVAAARSLSLALELPLLGVSGPSALAAAAVSRETVPTGREVLVATVDARRGEVFSLVLVSSEGGQWVSAGPVTVEDPEGLRQRLQHEYGGEPWIVGDERVADLPSLPEAAHLLLGHDRFEDAGLGPVPAMRSLIAREGVPAPGEPGSPESVVPLYVRSPDADRHIQKMRDPWAGAE